MFGNIFNLTHIKGFIICIWVWQHLIFLGTVWCCLFFPLVFKIWIQMRTAWSCHVIWSSLKDTFRQRSIKRRWFLFFLFWNPAQKKTVFQCLSYKILFGILARYLTNLIANALQGTSVCDLPVWVFSSASILPPTVLKHNIHSKYTI